MLVISRLSPYAVCMAKEHTWITGGADLGWRSASKASRRERCRLGCGESQLCTSNPGWGIREGERGCGEQAVMAVSLEEVSILAVGICPLWYVCPRAGHTGLLLGQLKNTEGGELMVFKA